MLFILLLKDALDLNSECSRERRYLLYIGVIIYVCSLRLTVGYNWGRGGWIPGLTLDELARSGLASRIRGTIAVSIPCGVCLVPHNSFTYCMCELE